LKITFAERSTNFCWGMLCCCTTTGESVRGISSLFRGLDPRLGRSSSMALRAQEWPSTLDIICIKTSMVSDYFKLS
jgi:hypothetical protein